MSRCVRCLEFDAAVLEAIKLLLDMTVELAAIRRVVLRIRRNPAMITTVDERLHSLLRTCRAKRKGFATRRTWERDRTRRRISQLERKLIEQRRHSAIREADLERRTIRLRQAIKAISDRAAITYPRQVNIEKMCTSALMGEPQ